MAQLIDLLCAVRHVSCTIERAHQALVMVLIILYTDVV